MHELETKIAERGIILTQLEQAFRRKSWHGTNLLGSIRAIDPDTAVWRPAAGRHNIWEIIVHAAYWKYSVWRRFSNDKSLKFAVKGSNWFERPVETTEAALKADVKLLKDYHLKLIAAIEGFTGRFDEIPAGSTTSYVDLAVGVAAHDLYHAGQIQLLKRLKQKS